MSEQPTNNGEIMETKPIVERDEKGRIKKGSVLNPKGKPIGTRHLSTILETMIRRTDKDTGIPHDVTILRKTIQQAERGDRYARDLIFDRIEGKAPQKIDITTGGDKITPSSETVSLANKALETYIQSNAKPSTNPPTNLPV